MGKFIKIMTLLCSCILSGVMIKAQEKLEKEYSIKQSEVPRKALEFMNHSFPGQKTKWYGEESLTGKSIEGKIKMAGKKYSVEFDTSGNLQDVEVLIGFKELPRDLQEIVEKRLQDLFSKFRIMKIQRQWKGAADAVKPLIANQQSRLPFQTNYELVVRGTGKEGTALYEILFDDKGTLLSSSRIIQKNVDHLIY